MTTRKEFNDILSELQEAPPVQMVDLANRLGINVYRVKNWPDSKSGRIYRSAALGGESGYAIDVNGKHSRRRRRFTIAHEISHFILHRDRIGDELTDDGLYRSGLPDIIEWQANGMAAEILMPKKRVYELANAQSSDLAKTISELASEFDVSEHAMSVRLGKAYD